jgi:hypothetical protein
LALLHGIVAQLTKLRHIFWLNGAVRGDLRHCACR